MDKTKILQNVLVLLKAAKENPSQFSQLIKDDMPHPANSPEDKAHDIVEEDESIKHALAILDTPEKQKKMFEHLRTLNEESQLRSPENEEVGQETMEKSYEKGVHKPFAGKDKSIMGHANRGHWSHGSEEGNKQKSKQEAKKVLSELKQMPKANLPKSEETMEKQSNPLFAEEKGVHQPVKAKGLKGGMSRAGLQTRISKETSVKGHPVAQESATEAKKMHQTKLKELKQMPKANLPKSEKDMEKKETKHDRCVDEVSKDPKIKNPHAVCVAAGVEPEKWKKGDKDMNKSEKSALELAKELLKTAKENPAQFEELSKALAPAAAPAPKPAAPKGAMPKPSMPKPPKMQAPGMMKEEKEESEEDESKEHESKESKEHEEKEMEKAAKKMDKCGDMKMSKEEIKADLKKEWKPKFKKG